MNCIFNATFLAKAQLVIQSEYQSSLFKHLVIVLPIFLRMTSPIPIGLTPGFYQVELVDRHYIVQEVHDLVFLSIFFVRVWLVSLIFQLTVDQSELVCVSTHLHPDMRVHENHVLSWQPSLFSGRLFGRMWMSGKRLYLRSMMLYSRCLLSPREGFSMRTCSTVVSPSVSSSERAPLEVSVNLAIALDKFPVLISILNCCASASTVFFLLFAKRYSFGVRSSLSDLVLHSMK